MRLVLHAFISLDGVVQAPGGPSEDPDGGFIHGGWYFPYADEAGGVQMAQWLASASAFLLGRRTYEIFSSYWPDVTDPDHPIAGPLNGLPKYVASTTLTRPAWNHSFVLGDDLRTEVADLKAQPGGELQVHGSGGLAQFLMIHGLIDEYRLLIVPVRIGSGKRLFKDSGPPEALTLVSSDTTSTGVIMATYAPDGPVRHGAFDDPAHDERLDSSTR